MTVQIFLSLIIGINFLGWIVIAFVMKHKSEQNEHEYKTIKTNLKKCNFKCDETLIFNDENYENEIKKYN